MLTEKIAHQLLRLYPTGKLSFSISHCASIVVSMVSRVVISMCSVMVVVNLLGNSLVCLVVLRDKNMRTTMNFLLVNLAISDMIVGVFSTFRLVIHYSIYFL